MLQEKCGQMFIKSILLIKKTTSIIASYQTFLSGESLFDFLTTKSVHSFTQKPEFSSCKHQRWSTTAMNY
jgi:hypothetical protein